MSQLLPDLSMKPSALTFFLLLLCKSNFAQQLHHAQWVTVSYDEGGHRRSCPQFEKSFTLQKPVAKAILTISGLGVYEASINGKRVGDGYLTPGFTVYNKRLQYQQYDVTTLLRKNNNIEVLVGEGWYRGTFRNEGSDKSRNNFGSEAGLLCALEIVYKDGSHQTIVSDSSWSCAKSNIHYSSLYNGEMQDTRMTKPERCPVRLLKTDMHLVPQENEPVKKHETFKPIRIFRAPNGDQLVDFGQNLAGWVSINIKGRADDTIGLEHAEVPDSAGNFYTGNLRNAKATDIYILNGQQQQLEPHFTYHGFRYVRVKGFDANKAHLRAVAVYSDLLPAGSFTCSDPLINQLYSNISWSLKSNFVDIPTDCPQRSERLGWTGDAQVFAATAMYMYDTRRFYQKWLRDVAAEQGSNGAIPNFVPRSMPGTDVRSGVAGWGDAATIIPAALFRAYADTTMLREQYPMMKKWADYMNSASKQGLFLNPGYGDWYAMGPKTSVPFIDQCFYAYSTRLVSEAANQLNEKVDAEKYNARYAAIKEKFITTYGNFNTPETQTQTAYVLALAFDLLPEAQRPVIAARLAEKIKQNGNKLATGFLGTPYLLPVLSRFGYTDLAWQLLQQQECPSWLYPVTRGATTIWERWDAIKPDGSVQATSFNHYAYGAVGQWLYESVGGIKPLEPGYKKILIAPQPGGTVTWAKTSFKSRYGLISTNWKIRGDQFVLNVRIPNGTTATVQLPDGTQKQVMPGSYTYQIPYPMNTKKIQP